MPLRKRKQKQTPKNKVMNSKENKELGVHLLTDINIVKSLQQGLIKSIWDQAYTQICQTQDPEGLHQSKWRKRNLGKENYLSSWKELMLTILTNIGRWKSYNMSYTKASQSKGISYTRTKVYSIQIVKEIQYFSHNDWYL